MPELPEVEVVRQSLDKRIKQKNVKKVIIRNRNLRFKIPIEFSSFLKNQKIIKVARYSKYLIFYLSSKKYILLHLGMSGTIHLIGDKKKKLITNASFYHSPFLPKKHNHVEIIFNDLRLIYNDPRRFGFFEIIHDFSSLKKRFAQFGPEPFEPKFNLNYLKFYLRGKKKNIKSFLLDQNFVSGIGNIYANEILFFSKIHPYKKAYLLKKEDYRKILKNSKKVLIDAIKKGGSSIRDFKDSTGRKGSFQKEFKVYDREGFRCKRLKCIGIIKKKIISNRSTYFCNICQK